MRDKEMRDKEMRDKEMRDKEMRDTRCKVAQTSKCRLPNLVSRISLSRVSLLFPRRVGGDVDQRQAHQGDQVFDDEVKDEDLPDDGPW